MNSDEHGKVVPFLDLGRETASIRVDLDAAWARVLDSGTFLFGGETSAFEAEFASYCGAEHAVGVASGFAALELILRAAGIGQGDEVIVPANTFVATWLSVCAVGARPVPVECERISRNIDPERVRSVVSSRTKAIVAVHLYGLPAEMELLRAICDEKGLALFVDAAQSTGATLDGKRVTTLGDAAAFSFYPTKNLGALADGGAVVSSDKQLVEKVRLLRTYGMRSRTDHPMRGGNARMEEIQAGVLRAKLKYLPSWLRQREEFVRRYRTGLESLEQVAKPEVPEGRICEPAWHLFVIQTKERDRLQKYLVQVGIETAVHYPVPPHLTEAFRNERYGNLPVTEELARTTLSLPFSPFHHEEEIDRVIAAIRSFFEEKRG